MLIFLKEIINYEKNYGIFLVILTLTFVACGKNEDIGSFLDKEKITSEFTIVEEDENRIELRDKDENRPVYRALVFKKMSSDSFKNPNKTDVLEEKYIEDGFDIIYKDTETIIIGGYDSNTYVYNIHNFDDTKTELSILVSVVSYEELSKIYLLGILKNVKIFIK